MNKITTIVLENEMDLILAHKQTMKLAELTGSSLSVQTTFATAVSEISRTAIDPNGNSVLTLYVSEKADKARYVTVILEDQRSQFSSSDEGYIYARRLVSNIDITFDGSGNKIILKCRIPDTVRVDDINVEKWRINLNNDPAISPYEEIKRKNRQLIEMADKLRESEQQYKVLTDSLPVMIYTITTDGKLTYANKWLEDYTGLTIRELNANLWQSVIHPEDYPLWKKRITEGTGAAMMLATERRLKENSTGEYRWHKGIAIAITDEEGRVKSWNNFMVDVHAQKMIEQAFRDNVQLKEMHAQLEEKITLLNRSNQQLEQFAYVASHDLQEPLRKIGFYSDYLKKKYSSNFPAEASMFFDNLINATDRMKVLIQDILAYSTVSQDEFSTVDLNQVAADVLQDLEITIAEKEADVQVGPLPEIEGNARQLTQLFENILSNSLKFSKNDERPKISIAAETGDNEVTLTFTDNGIGFEELYIHKIFNLFQRLHVRDKYKGTGIGLAICKKITELHNGTINATSTLDEGATFTVTLPIVQSASTIAVATS